MMNRQENAPKDAVTSNGAKQIRANKSCNISTSDNLRRQDISNNDNLGTLIWETDKRDKRLRFMVREYYHRDGAWLHGKKGCTMPIERIGELGAAISAYAKQNEL